MSMKSDDLNLNTPNQYIEHQKLNPSNAHEILQGTNTEKDSEIRVQAEDQVNRELTGMIEECMRKILDKRTGLQ